MKNALVIGTLGVAVSFGMLAAGYLAGSGMPAGPAPHVAAADQGAGGIDKPEIERIVHAYIVANPEVLIEAQATLEARHLEEQQLSLRETLQSRSDLIYRAAHDGVIGNPAARISVVEFFDYNCTYCRRALGDMEKMVRDDPDLRFVLKEFPILGPDSQKAHVVSMALQALAPEKYPEFHTRLLGSSGRATEDAAIGIATALGIDEAALREAMKDPAIGNSFQQTFELAEALSINGTPAYIIGDEIVSGALGHAALGEKVAAAREACATASC